MSIVSRRLIENICFISIIASDDFVPNYCYGSNKQHTQNNC